MAKEKPDNQSEKAILAAARKVFTQKGYAAARMDDIAKEAGINRALLHYYFRSKDRMFDIIFEERVNEFFSGLARIVFSDLSVIDKIKAIVEHDLDMVTAQPDLPIFIMQELAQNPQRLIDSAHGAGAVPGLMMKKLNEQIKAAVQRGHIKNIDGGQLLINIMSLSIYPFIAKPMIKKMQDLDDAGFDKMMMKRKREVADFIIDALMP